MDLRGEFNERIGVIMFSPVQDHALIEIGGSGCKAILAARHGIEVFRRIDSKARNITRLDISVDFETGVSPDEFVMAAAAPKKMSRAAMDSETGSTRYIGSRKSDRYLKVYRYSRPHDRAHLLRVEFTLKTRYAQVALRRFLAGEREALAGGLAKPYKFGHSLWRFDGDKIEVPTEHRNAGYTHWLAKAVIPSLAKKRNEIPDKIWYELAYVIPKRIVDAL